MSLIAELKRRNVFKVGAAYAVMAWLIAQGVDVFLENFGAPDWVIKTILLLLVAGLPIALLFAWAFELTPEGLKKEKDVDRSQSITHETGRKLDFVIIGVLLVALSWFAWDKFAAPTQPDPNPTVAQEATQGHVSEETTPTASSTLADEKSIAVLPFVNMSSDPEQEYFSDGISEEILNALAKVKDLQVSGRTSSFAFKGQNQDLRQIGETLGVNHVLEGSVRKSGNTVRITAQLIRVDNGFHLWSETYDREMDNVFAIQDEISNAILHELKATLLTDNENDQAPRAQRTNSAAYDHYLLAKQRMYERTRPSIAAAVELLDKAIAADPEYAPAYAQRGIVAILSSKGQGSYGDLPLKQSQAEGKLYLEKALQLDPALPEALAGMGLYHIKQPGELDVAIETLQQALELNPGMIDAKNWLQNALTAAGRPAEAYAVTKELIQRDPLYRPAIGNAIIAMVGFGEIPQAREYLERIQAQLPDSNVVLIYDAYLDVFEGNTANAIKGSQRMLERVPEDPFSNAIATWSYTSLGEFESALAYDDPYGRMLALVYSGRIEEAKLHSIQLAEKDADVETLFGFYNLAGRSPELVQYLEERWPDLESFQADFPPYGTNGYSIMLEVALAYSRVGNVRRFDDAMNRLAQAQSFLLSEGVANQTFFATESSRLALSGDRESSLDFLEKAVDYGLLCGVAIQLEYPALASLVDEPRFAKLQTRITERRNEERLKMGLEPLEI